MTKTTFVSSGQTHVQRDLMYTCVLPAGCMPTIITPVLVLIYHSLSGFTELIPHILEDDVQCGLSTRLLRRIVEIQDVNEALLKYVVFELPQSGIKKPYDARGIDVVRILSKSADYRLIERLLMLGMNLKQRQMEVIVLLIPPEDTPTFELLLKCATRNKFSKNSLTVACTKAMDALKFEFIPFLIDCGAALPTDQLLNVVGLSDNVSVRQYLETHATSESDVRKLSSETSDIGERKDTGSHTTVIKVMMICACVTTYLNSLLTPFLPSTHTCGA